MTDSSAKPNWECYPISVHAVILNEKKEVLQLKQTYTDLRWGLPWGSVEKWETVHAALKRECIEELDCAIDIKYTSGIYYHSKYNSHVVICLCSIVKGEITLSSEHSEYRYFPLDTLSEVQQVRVRDCLEFSWEVKCRAF